MVRNGWAGRGLAGKAWLGRVRRGWARFGAAGRGMAGVDWHGEAGHGSAGLAGVFEMTDPWINHKDSCANCGALRVMIADGLCRACWRDTNGDAEMEKEDRYAD